MAREADRLEALRSCAIIDTQPEADFDDLVAVAAVVAEAPHACIAFVDETRWWVKAWVGQVARELPRGAVLCAESFATAEPMVVDDVRADPRFALHPALESDPHLRFYVALPLVLDGCLAVGALCVSDRKPRSLRPAQLAALQRVARQVVRLVSFRRHATVLAEAHEALAIGEAQYRLLADTATDAIVTVDDNGRILFANPAVERLFGYTSEEVVGEPLSMLAPERDRPAARSGLRRCPRRTLSGVGERGARGRAAQGRARDRARALVRRRARRTPALLHRHPARHRRSPGGRAGAHPGARAGRSRARGSSRNSSPT